MRHKVFQITIVFLALCFLLFALYCEWLKGIDFLLGLKLTTIRDFLLLPAAFLIIIQFIYLLWFFFKKNFRMGIKAFIVLVFFIICVRLGYQFERYLYLAATHYKIKRIGISKLIKDSQELIEKYGPVKSRCTLDIKLPKNKWSESLSNLNPIEIWVGPTWVLVKNSGFGSHGTGIIIGLNPKDCIETYKYEKWYDGIYYAEW